MPYVFTRRLLSTFFLSTPFAVVCAQQSDTLTLQAFRFLHQVTVGMEKGQVEVLLGPAFTTSDDPQQMANWARRHWPLIRGRADEAWGYPFGWFFYFDKGKVVAITQYLEGAPYQ